MNTQLVAAARGAALMAGSVVLALLLPAAAVAVDAPPDISHGDVVYVGPPSPATEPTVPGPDSTPSLLAIAVIAAAGGSLVTELTTSARVRRRRPLRRRTSTSPAARTVSTRTPPWEDRPEPDDSRADVSQDDTAAGRSRLPGPRRRTDPQVTATADWGPADLLGEDRHTRPVAADPVLDALRRWRTGA